MNELNPPHEIALLRFVPPDHASDVVAITCTGETIVLTSDGPRLEDGGVVDERALIQAVVRACIEIWPDDWRRGYQMVFDANPARLTRALPPPKIMKVISWARSSDNPAETVAALIAASCGVDELTFDRAERAFRFSEILAIL